MLLHWCPEQSNAKALVKWRDLLSGQWKGPDPLLTSGRGYACIFPQGAKSSIWILDRLTHHVAVPQTADSPQKRKRKLCRRSPGAAGGVSLTDGTQCAALAAPSSAMVSAEGGARAAACPGMRGKINFEIPAGLTAAAAQTPTRK